MKYYSFLMESEKPQQSDFTLYDRGVSEIKKIISDHNDVHILEKVSRGEAYIIVYRGEPTKHICGFMIYPDKAQSSASQFGLLGHKNGPLSCDCTENDVKCAIKALKEWL